METERLAMPMGDIRTYLLEHGGDALCDRPLCDADLLVFAQLSYCDFAPAAADTPFQTAVQAVLDAPPSEEDTEQRFPFQRKDDEMLLRLTRICVRYQHARFLRYAREYDGENVQFAALALDVGGQIVVVYRGTDCTLAGWKEDVDLCYRMPVRAQALALAFLEDIAAQSGLPITVCGHSKGGNLAVYAALHAGEALWARVEQVISFDGVGLPAQVLQHFETNTSYAPLLSRMRVILPEASVVGVIFPQPGTIRTVNCRYLGLLQHYPYFFVIEGTDFVQSERTLFSRAAAIAVDEFLSQLTFAERERFITLVYDIVRATKAQTMQDILRGWFKNTVPVAKAALKTLDSDSAKLYLKVITSFFSALARTAGVLLKNENTDAKGTEHP